MKQYVRLLICIPACGGWMSAATAQSYPAKPVRIIVPYAAGGPYDDIVRTLGQRLTEIWGHAVIVENRGGAGGNIGSEVVAKGTGRLW